MPSESNHSPATGMTSRGDSRAALSAGNPDLLRDIAAQSDAAVAWFTEPERQAAMDAVIARLAAEVDAQADAVARLMIDLDQVSPCGLVDAPQHGSPKEPSDR